MCPGDKPFSLDGKASAYNVGDLGSIPGSGRSPGEGNGYTLQYSCLENSIDRGAWWAIQSIVCKELDMTVCSANTCTHIDLNQLFYILPLIGTLVTFTPPLR